MPLEPFARGLFAEAAFPKEVEGGRPKVPVVVPAVQVDLHTRHNIVEVDVVSAISFLRERGRSL